MKVIIQGETEIGSKGYMAWKIIMSKLEKYEGAQTCVLSAIRPFAGGTPIVAWAHIDGVPHRLDAGRKGVRLIPYPKLPDSTT